MGNLNVCSLICKNVDKQEQIIKNIVNEIEMPSNEDANIVVVTIVNGIEIEEKEFNFDYFLNYLGDDDAKKPMYAPLFSVKMCIKEGNKITGKKTQHRNSLFEILYDEIDPKFPGKGNYELEVYLNDEDNGKDLSAKDRYEDYKEKNKRPISIYGFVVK